MRRFVLVLLAFAAIACATTPQKTPQGGSDVVAPVVISRVAPIYPEELRREGVQGTVTMSALITRTGEVANIRVVRSTDPRLEDLAMDALRQWRFQPGKLEGTPVDVEFQVTIAFSTNR